MFPEFLASVIFPRACDRFERAVDQIVVQSRAQLGAMMTEPEGGRRDGEADENDDEHEGSRHCAGVVCGVGRSTQSENAAR